MGSRGKSGDSLINVKLEAKCMAWETMQMERISLC